MANIQVTNSSSTAQLLIDVDAGDRFNRVAKWVFSAGEVKSIGEEEIKTTEDFALPDALRSSQATVTETDIDALSSVAVKNFLASGLDQTYKLPSATLHKDKRVVGLDSTNNKVRYVVTAGDKPFGVAKQDGTASTYTRVKTAGSVTVVAGGTITSGAKLISDTTGRVTASTTIGLWQVGLAGADQTTGGDLTITLDIKQIA